MTRKQAIEWCNSRPMTLSTAYGVTKWNNEYIIVTGSQMKRHDYKLIHVIIGEKYTFKT